MPSFPYITEDILKQAIQAVYSSKQHFSEINKISDYLYEITYDTLDYDFASKYFKEHDAAIQRFACTSVRKGNWFGRNFDWFYNHDCDFVIRTSGFGRIPSLGVAGGVSTLTKQFVESGANSYVYKILPFFTLDGINEAGVFINSNVVPQDRGRVIATKPTENKEMDMFLIMWPRFVLDKFTSALEAIEYAQKHISFFQITQASLSGYDIHFMIGDSTGTWVVEIIDNKIAYKPFNIMTNFHVVPTEYNADGSVYTPGTQDAEHDASKTNKISKHGSGLERHNVANANIANIQTKEDMVNLMHNLLNYNNSYKDDQNPLWYTEFVGSYPSGEYTVSTPAVIYDEKVIPVIREWFATRSRETNPQSVWHTTHTSVYDLQNKKLYVYDSTEDGVEHVFNFNKYYTAAEIDALLANLK